MIALDYTTANLLRHGIPTVGLQSLARVLQGLALVEHKNFTHRDFLDGKEVQAVGWAGGFGQVITWRILKLRTPSPRASHRLLFQKPQISCLTARELAA